MGKGKKERSSFVAQGVKDLVLSLLCIWLQLWHSFNPWLGNFHMLWAWPEKKKKKKIRAEKGAITPPFEIVSKN